MNWYKKAQGQTVIAWHVSNNKFKTFDISKSAQGIIWFAKDKDDLLTNLHGASINNTMPVYLYKCAIKTNKIAGWNEYDKYGLWELRRMGYDTINLDDDLVALDPKNVRIEGMEQIK